MAWESWQENPLNRWGRRLVAISLYSFLFVAAVLLLPVLLPAALFWDVAASPWQLFPRSRCLIFFTWYLFCEVAGLAAAFAVWCVSGRCFGAGAARFERWNAALQGLWAEALYRGGKILFSLELVMDGADCIASRPVIMLMRHASTVDTVFPHVLVANPRKMMLRFVLKKELLWDPCVDVVGNRLRNIFVDRSGLDSQKDIGAVRRLAMDLKPSEGVVIFPEGTRFHPEKLKRAVQKLELAGDTVLFELAAKMTHVLPPRPGGFLALLEAAPDADVVFCAHTGLEGAATFRHLWKGVLIGKTVYVRFHKLAASEIPQKGRDALIWLYEEWLGIDRWIKKKGTPLSY